MYNINEIQEGDLIEIPNKFINVSSEDNIVKVTGTNDELGIVFFEKRSYPNSNAIQFSGVEIKDVIQILIKFER